MNSILLEPKHENSKNLEDFNVSVKPLKLDQHNCDIWSLGITILEMYLSLYIMKKDAREMVHNMYLNKLSY
jgi:hypothetical protein